MVHVLKGVLREDPYDSRANLRLAAKNLQLFDEAQQASENPMGLAQIRDAALASGFPSQADLDRWLDVVMGPRREWLDQALEHTQRAVRLSPLQGDAYIYLGELSFLDRRQVLPQQSLLEQALRARPYNGYVLLAAGSEAAQQGDAERALELWKRGFSLDPDVQKEIVQRLASQVSAEEFLREFPTDQSCLLYLFRHYQKAGSVDQAQIVAPPLLAAIQEELDAEPPPERQAMLWDQVRVAEECLGNVVGAAEAASRAVALSPDNYGRHYQLAHALMARCDYDAACREFQWCLRRRPEDAGLQRQLTAAAKLRVAEGSQTQLR
jgi:tetratricopeptide (TPR) repeat protein